MRKNARRWLFAGGAALLGVGGAAGLFYRAVGPVGAGGRETYLRVASPRPLDDVIREMGAMNALRSTQATLLLSHLTRRRATVPTGTYRVSGGKSAWDNLRSLRRPIVQMVRIPETNWSRRTANILQKKDVATAEEYLAEVNHPAGRRTGFPLPNDTLEGYLYPDTYDLPPLLGAKAVVGRQLEAFRRKVWEPLGHPKDLHRIVILASLVELEAGTEADRAMIAGVIENRLKKKMRLQIDASLLYGMGKWRNLTFKDYREFDSPYNLYRVAGLPPTPICSPSVASIRAAMAPARHNDVYYVALPNGTSLFAATYEEHKKNIEKRKEALRAEALKR